MQKLRYGQLVVMVGWTCVLSAQSLAEPGQVTVMTYNVQNMFDVFDDPYTLDETTRVKPRHQISRIAAMIRRANADIVAFQEVENEGVLKAMVHEMLPRAGYRYVAATATNSDRGGNLGLISRLPVLSLTSHRLQDLALTDDPQTWRFARDLLLARIRVPGDRVLALFIVHLKSKRDSEGDEQSRRWRLAEAVAARRIVDAWRHEHPSEWTLVVGDVNDTPQSPTLNALLVPNRNAPRPLTDVHAHLPTDRRVTYLRPPYRSTVDYILAGPDLAARVVPNSARVPADASQLGGSDHAPVVAAFDLRE